MYTLREAIEKARQAYELEQAEHAIELGTTPDRIEADRKLKKRIDARRNAVLMSGIGITRSDLEMIACGGSKQTKAIVAATRWANDPARPILILCGDYGTGKTYAAAIAIASCGFGVAIRSPDLPQSVKPNATEIMAGMDRVALNHPLIVLDDLGSEANPKHPRFVDALLSFVDSRALHGRTIITTNLRADQFRQRYDPRVVQRLEANAVAVELPPGSLRPVGGGLL